MKNYLLTSVFILIMFICGRQLKASENNYQTLMTKYVFQLDSAQNVDQYITLKNIFDRIIEMYPQEWLPVYYSAYCNIQVVYCNQKANQNQSFLDEAKQNLDKISRNKEADQSEINTMYGYYYNALILLNPKENGQKYYSQVMSYYQKAETQNPQNPRPIFLSALFNRNLPSFLQNGKDYCQELDRADLLFQNSTQELLYPHWGISFLNGIKSSCIDK